MSCITSAERVWFCLGNLPLLPTLFVLFIRSKRVVYSSSTINNNTPCNNSSIQNITTLNTLKCQ